MSETMKVVPSSMHFALTLGVLFLFIIFSFQDMLVSKYNKNDRNSKSSTLGLCCSKDILSFFRLRRLHVCDPKL